jgi:hypothetical protein
MNITSILKKNDVQSLIQRQAIKNFENIPEDYYSQLNNSQITFEKLNIFEEIKNEIYEQEIRPFLSTKFFIDLHDPIDNQLLKEPARGINCKHIDCMNFRTLISQVAITE